VDRLQGRAALVTGAASGIGQATAKRLASEGAAVLVTDIQDAAGTQVVKDIIDGGGRASYHHLDVTSQPAWEAAVATALEEFGRLDILVNNAGMGDLAAIEDTSLEDWNRTIGIDQPASSWG
jgi:NAD(P)-dependent dehydrogenase (short-subunit alcohol dehydrogenase family)